MITILAVFGICLEILINSEVNPKNRGPFRCLINNTNLEISNDLDKYEIKRNIFRYIINLLQFKRILLKNAKSI